MTIDTTVNLNTIVNTIVGCVVTAIGYGLRHAYIEFRNWSHRIQSFDSRIEDTAEVVDQHSDILLRSGWARSGGIKPVSKKRRASDYEPSR